MDANRGPYLMGHSPSEVFVEPALTQAGERRRIYWRDMVETPGGAGLAIFGHKLGGKSQLLKMIARAYADESMRALEGGSRLEHEVSIPLYLDLDLLGPRKDHSLVEVALQAVKGLLKSAGRHQVLIDIVIHEIERRLRAGEVGRFVFLFDHVGAPGIGDWMMGPLLSQRPLILFACNSDVTQLPDGLRKCEITPFDDTQIELFLANCGGAVNTLKSKMERDVEFRELMRHPYLLARACEAVTDSTRIGDLHGVYEDARRLGLWSGPASPQPRAFLHARESPLRAAMHFPMSPWEDEVRETIRRVGPREAFRQCIAANDALIRAPELNNGREIALARSAIYTALMKDWAEEQRALSGYDRPFAIMALGSTGRGEMTPCSDADFVCLFDDAIEGNKFLLELRRQVVDTDEFQQRCGFTFEPLANNLEDIPRLEGKQLNAFIDMVPVYDPHGLAAEFRKRIRETFDPFEHFLLLRRSWRKQWEKPAHECERLDRFEIKHEGLRVFLAGIWTRAGTGAPTGTGAPAERAFLHSHDIYRTLDKRDLEAYYFLLRIRAFVHSRRPPPSRTSKNGIHPEDLLGFEDFVSFGELLGPDADETVRFEFANAVRARLLAARRQVARFSIGVAARELRVGRQVSPESAIVYGSGGLRHTASHECATPHEKSRAALSLLLASQRYRVPIDRSEVEHTFRDAGDWLTPVPELSALFYERRGSLAKSFEFLSQFNGAEDRLFPGYAKFEASVDGRVLFERRSLRGPLVQEKLRALEEYLERGQKVLAKPPADPTLSDLVRIETALLDVDHLAAVKLALKTKRLPLTPHDRALRQDASQPLHERFSTGVSEIDLDEYYFHLAACEFTPETLRVTRFLVAHRGVFKERSRPGIADKLQIRKLVETCKSDESLLRTLFVFSCADRAVWESEAVDPVRWFNTRALYLGARRDLRPGVAPTGLLTSWGYSPEELKIIEDLGSDFFGGEYGHYAQRFGSHLVRLAWNPTQRPKASILREGASTIIGVTARDYPGLAASISGALWRHGIALRQAHLFSATNYRLALDFFHLAPATESLAPEVIRLIEDAIERQLYIGADEEVSLPRAVERPTLEVWRHGLYCLRAETSGDVGALICVLTYKLLHRLGGNVFGLTAHAGRAGAWVTVYHTLPPGLSLEKAREIIREFF
ncbi:MAG TPA: DUF294 nucleotidyltransferase-like domain-containing protein [Chthoniobacteraceae bacterium]|nr:DUF294 nucleotidyltransferase-like domain-containing protein [Chthoniobacteraceae bacterium]